MRAAVQRVRRAAVRVGDELVGEMGEGLLALVGVGHDDGPEDATALAHKLVRLRVFEAAAGRMDRALTDTGGTLGVVAQFTLFADLRRGHRPSFADAAPPEHAAPLVEAVAEAARALEVPVMTGRFRATMQVELVNDGPVTLWIDTRDRRSRHSPSRPGAP